MPLLAWVPLFGAIAGCHCWCAIAGCHCGVPWLDAIAGAIAACHCEKPLREKIDQSVTPFSAALFSALITHKNWLVLSGVYAGIILRFRISIKGCKQPVPSCVNEDTVLLNIEKWKRERFPSVSFRTNEEW